MLCFVLGPATTSPHRWCCQQRNNPTKMSSAAPVRPTKTPPAGHSPVRAHERAWIWSLPSSVPTCCLFAGARPSTSERLDANRGRHSPDPTERCGGSSCTDPFTRNIVHPRDECGCRANVGGDDGHAPHHDSAKGCARRSLSRATSAEQSTPVYARVCMHVWAACVTRGGSRGIITR